MAVFVSSRFQNSLPHQKSAIPAILPLLLLFHLFLGFDPAHSSVNSSESYKVDRGISSASQSWLKQKLNPSQNLTMSDVAIGTRCNIFSGHWVHDLSYPLYDWSKCPYIDGEFNCQKNGRPDSDYQKWRWKPSYCNLRRFNALDMLQKLRGKTLMFVGDSLNRDQWQSMICLLHAALPQGRTYVVSGDTLSSFRAMDYGVTVSFYRAPYLVDMVTITVQGQQKVVLRLDSAENNGRGWKGADILVFNSGHWWTHTGNLRGWDYLQEGNTIYTSMDFMVAYRKGMTTWANWIDSNIDTSRTKVLFRSFSPSHSSTMNGGNCYSEKEPTAGTSYLGAYPPQFQVAESVVRAMRSPVSFLNITTLSLLRQDAHPSIYSNDLTVGQRKNPQRYADCSHWCLPGLPDIWNEILYSALFYP